jgi:hypothetical protein
MGADPKPAADPLAHDANGLPTTSADAGAEMPPAVNGAAKPAEAPPGQPQTETAAVEPGSAGVKTGA